MEKIIIASGPVIVENDKVLLDQHGDTDFWKFCGGRVKEDESLIDAAKKRSKEELGIDIEFLDENPYLTFTEKETETGSLDVILAHFLARSVGEIKPRADIREWKWFDINDLPANLGPNIIPALQHFGFLK
jgi:ADP-ribose pyrophosphatase YjhB (NUDIX family)